MIPSEHKFHHVGNFMPKNLEELKIAGKRHYRLGDMVFPSVTTVLSAQKNEGLQAWKDSIGHDVASYIARTSAKTGTDFHKIAQDFLDNKDTDMYRNMLFPYAHFDLIRGDLGRINNIRALEATLFSTRLKIAGRVDIVAEFDGVLSVIDLKSARTMKNDSILDNHAIQETAYAACWTEQTGITIEQIVTIVSCQDGNIQISKNDPAAYKSRLEQCIKDFESLQKENLRQNPKGNPVLSTKFQERRHGRRE